MDANSNMPGWRRNFLPPLIIVRTHVALHTHTHTRQTGIAQIPTISGFRQASVGGTQKVQLPLCVCVMKQKVDDSTYTDYE